MPLFLSILWQETADDPALRAKAFAGLKAYQHAARAPRHDDGAVIASAGAARLLRSGQAKAGRNKPVVLIPSLINPPHVMDLAPGNSLMAYLAGQELDVHLVDWGNPRAEDRDLDLAGHVTERLAPMLATLSAPPLLVGYCLGGTIAAAAAAIGPAAGLVTIAAPWHFAGIDAESRATVAALWKSAEPACRRLGYVPMEVLQAGFWQLDPERTIRKYAGFADFDPASPTAQAFMAVEDWANAGAPLTYAAGRSLFEELYAADMSGTGTWRIGGVAADPRPAGMPTLAIASAADLIVPAAASPQADERWTLELGHVGMIVSRKAPQALWQPLAEWLSRHAGSVSGPGDRPPNAGSDPHR